MDLSVIIVSYNTADLIGPCLASLEETSQTVSREVFVVDNASPDGSTEIIRRDFPAVHLVANTDNKGFAAANNQVLPLCRGDFILFLNPDTQVMPDTLGKAIAYMKKHPDIGLAGAKIINPDGTPQESVSHRYPGEKFTRGDLPLLKGEIACVLGAAMIAKRDVISAVGGFDEDFFLYGEDEDLCLRLRKAAWKIGYINEAPVIHVGGQSERRTESAEKWRKKIRAAYLFYGKHYRPDTIARIRRSDRLKAYWRILSLSLFMPFFKDSGKAHEKRRYYSVVLAETSFPLI